MFEDATGIGFFIAAVAVIYHVIVVPIVNAWAGFPLLPDIPIL